ncbi:MAG: NFACT RNA binding domain-containing protein [Cyclobacteriaceae bacterium]|nr:NFACT RNA binding domain-containing protein [Cyclobacteriaceae bacterium]
MHNNFYFLRNLSTELETELKGSVISECFSQNKDELIIRFETKSKSFFIKASLQSEFCCLSFPDDFIRARKNSVDLFGEIIGQRILGIRQFNNERCFSLKLSNQFQLLFKMHGNRANLVLFKDDQAMELFRNHLSSDMEIDLQNLDKEIDWSEGAFIENIENLKQHYFTFGKILWSYLESKDFSFSNQKFELIQNLLKELGTPKFYLTEIKNQFILSLVPMGNIQTTHSNALSALNGFFTEHSIQGSFLQEKQTVLSKLNTLKKNCESYLHKTQLKLKEIESDDHYKLWADLIMANLHHIKPGLEKITLSTFHEDQNPIDVKLKKDLSPQKNAEIYYRKSKNHHIEIEKLKEAINRKLQEEKKLVEQIAQLSEVSDLKMVRSLVKALGIEKDSSKQKNFLPYHEVEFQNYKIWIGKNSKSNDELTQRHTYKEDLWLHAKDVPGSHVVIKFQSGKKFPKEVIERAAQLAAYNSKRKTDTLCPVVYTPKKYVRKRKGDLPGTVMVDKETVIMVEPIGS